VNFLLDAETLITTILNDVGDNTNIGANPSYK